MIVFRWDAWPRPLRHLAILLLGGLLDWAAREGLPAVGPWLASHEPLGPLVGALAAQLLLVVLPLVRYQDPGPDPLAFGTGARSDRGSVGALLLVALAVVALLAASAGPAAARWRPAPRPALAAVVLEHIGTGPALACAGVLTVAYSTEVLTAGAWTPRPDDGRVTLQVHDAAGWHPAAAVSGGEGRLRLPVPSPVPDLVRVVRSGVAAVGRPIEACS